MNCFGYLEGVNGVKTGFTNGAGRCLVTSIERDDFNIITVVLGADTKKIRTSDSIKLIEYTYKNYELIDLEEIVKQEFENWKAINGNRIQIYKAKNNNLNLSIGELQYSKYPVKKDEKADIWVDIDAKNFFEAPIEKNTIIGNVQVLKNTTGIMDVAILNYQKIEKKGIWDYLLEFNKILF